MSLYLISLLKFIEVKYPVDVFAIFEENIGIFPNFLNNVKIQENNKDNNKVPVQFLKFDTSPYILNNCKELLL